MKEQQKGQELPEESNVREPHPDQGFRKFWPMMKKMTWKERFKHIVFYYAKYALIAAFLIYMGIDVLYDAYKPKTEIILAGTAVNVHVSVEMQKRLCEDAFASVGGTDPKKQEVTLVANSISYTDLYSGASLQTKFLANDYHYAIMDKTGMEMLISMQAFPDLTDVLSESELEYWKDRYISVQTEGETYPIALDITGTPLAAGCVYDGERVFMSFPVNLETRAVIGPFMEYLHQSGLVTFP